MEVFRRIGAAFGARGIPYGMDERVPAGQYVTPKMPVMTVGGAPRIDPADWRLSIFGEVERSLELTWDEYLSLATDELVADFHCVTQWTRLNVGWEGAQAMRVIGPAGPTPRARFAMVHCHDGYTTNVDLTLLGAPDTLFAHRMDGAPLPPSHGGPVRLVAASRYGWKSAKWVKGIELVAEDSPGFWEQNGYHMRGDPWREERFSGY